jgi:hypothetical protein
MLALFSSFVRRLRQLTVRAPRMGWAELSHSEGL